PSSKQSQGTICLLNVGSSITSVNILDNRLVRLSRDIHFGGVNFTRKIMDLFEMDFKSAEASKINPPSDKAARIRASMEGLLTSLASEIRTSFDYYESQNTVSVSRIFLSGGAGRMAGLRETLSASLGLPVETWDPFRKIIIPDTVDKKKLEGLSGHFNVAVGLALR
ncbi:MAG: pilus assembly protein PilM, partial [Candidatus Omnitrophica bacterium]|nr:pilus assembly protein PilM [Candidatus Omnitrophota bacterium]